MSSLRVYNVKSSKDKKKTNWMVCLLSASNFWLDLYLAAFDMLKQIKQMQRLVFSFSHAQVNPKYLHSNSTSHTWPFSAIAELIGES